MSARAVQCNLLVRDFMLRVQTLKTEDAGPGFISISPASKIRQYRMKLRYSFEDRWQGRSVKIHETGTIFRKAYWLVAV